MLYWDVAQLMKSGGELHRGAADRVQLRNTGGQLHWGAADSVWLMKTTDIQSSEYRDDFAVESCSRGIVDSPVFPLVCHCSAVGGGKGKG